MDERELREELERRARAEGFDALGIARARPLERDVATLEAWLGRGQHAGMHWLARDPPRRADPARLLPGCRSVISLAMSYWPGARQAAVPAGRARVALYARGRDYHKVLSRKLRRLAAWLEQVSGCASRTFVDTGPVLERAWAEQAGIGWIGKNANLLTRERGSWLMLGEILTTAPLEASPGPHAEFCGSCTACLAACPTGAIVADGVVDSNRCISYWTIEHRGPIPVERRSGLGEWIFGCDVCQDVCPWNRSFAREAPYPFEARDDLRGLDPCEILALDETEFRRRFSGTALMRAKWEGLRRNACVVLGNRGDAADVALLARTLADPDPTLRAHAAWALGRIGGARARAELAHARPGESDAEVRAEIDHALGAS
jgi:epoxyqueuosine reductase